MKMSTKSDLQRVVRIALPDDCDTNDVRSLVLSEALRLAGVGATAGLLGALATTRLVRGMLFEVDPLDPLVLVGAALSLIAASLLAAWVPMRRATRLDPAGMLRSQ